MEKNELTTEVSILSAKEDEELLIADAIRRMREPTPKHVPCRKGQKRGRLTIISYSHQGNKRVGGWNHLWLTRCICGNYELRSQKTLGKKQVQEDMCQQCHHHEHLKWKARNGTI